MVSKVNVTPAPAGRICKVKAERRSRESRLSRRVSPAVMAGRVEYEAQDEVGEVSQRGLSASLWMWKRWIERNGSVFEHGPRGPHVSIWQIPSSWLALSCLGVCAYCVNTVYTQYWHCDPPMTQAELVESATS